MAKIEKIQGYNYFKNEKIQGIETRTATAVGKFASRRENGIYVVLIDYLKDYTFKQENRHKTLLQRLWFW